MIRNGEYAKLLRNLKSSLKLSISLLGLLFGLFALGLTVDGAFDGAVEGTNGVVWDGKPSNTPRTVGLVMMRSFVFAAF